MEIFTYWISALILNHVIIRMNEYILCASTVLS